MINIKIKTDFQLPKNIAWKVIQVWLYNTSETAIEQAREFAPYKTWRLKASIWRMPANVTENTRKIVVWPRKIKYAIIREYINYKNPDRRFYMKKTYKKIPDIAKIEFNTALKIILKKYV
jgi:hypothetical protein